LTADLTLPASDVKGRVGDGIPAGRLRSSMSTAKEVVRPIRAEAMMVKVERRMVLVRS
jgi:hypothetical protein